MIQHVVCIRFKPGTSSSAIDQAGQALVALKGRIPEIRGIRWGANLAPSSTEYPWVLSVLTEDMPAVQRYLDHPEHVRVVQEHLAPVREARLALDFEA